MDVKQERIDRLESEIDKLESDPSAEVEDRINKIEEKLPTLTYKNTPEGDMCMKEFLKLQKRAYHQDGVKIINSEINEKKSKLQDLKGK